MLDKPQSIKDVTRDVEKPTSLGSDPTSSSVQADHRDTFKAESQRAEKAFSGMRDDFGRPMFPTADRVIASNGQSVNAAEMYSRKNPDFVSDRLDQASQRKANQDTTVLAGMEEVGKVDSPQDARGALDRIEKAAQFGLDRAVRLTNVMDKRDVDTSAGTNAQEQILSRKAEKTTAFYDDVEAAKKDDPAAKARDKDGKAKDADGKDQKNKDGKDPTDDKSPLTLLLDGQNPHRPEAAKNFADWAEVRSTVGGLRNDTRAEEAMNDLGKMANRDNQAAVDAVTAALIANSGVENAWTANRRAESTAATALAIPELAPGMETALKGQAAKSLIEVGDQQGGLTRSQNMALAVAMGQAFANREQYDPSKANADLLHTTANYFIKLGRGIDSATEAAASRQRNVDSTLNLRNALQGLTDAVNANAPGSEHIARVLGEVAASALESEHLKKRPDQTSKKNIFQALFSKFDSFRENFDSKRRNRDGSDAVGELNKEEILKSCDIIKGQRAQAHMHGLGEGTENLIAMYSPTRAKFRVGERSSLVELKDGRAWDPVLDRVFKRVGGMMIEDDKPKTEQDKAHIADLVDKKNAKATWYLGTLQAAAAKQTQHATTKTHKAKSPKKKKNLFY